MKLTKDTLQNVFASKIGSIETMQIKGYELVKELFVDSSGFGLESEPALTESAFINELESLLRIHGTLYSTLTGVGQFQVYVGLFKRTANKKSKCVANNTLQYTKDDGSVVIRLHDTDIVTTKGQNIKLDTGGWFSKTTKERINQYLPRRYSVVQRNFDWYITDDLLKKTIPFIGNKITLP